MVETVKKRIDKSPHRLQGNFFLRNHEIKFVLIA